MSPAKNSGSSSSLTGESNESPWLPASNKSSILSSSLSLDLAWSCTLSLGDGGDCHMWKLDSCHLALKNTHFSAEYVFLTVAIPGTLGPFLHPIRLKIEQFGIQPQQALLLGWKPAHLILLFVGISPARKYYNTIPNGKYGHLGTLHLGMGQLSPTTNQVVSRCFGFYNHLENHLQA